MATPATQSYDTVLYRERGDLGIRIAANKVCTLAG